MNNKSALNMSADTLDWSLLQVFLAVHEHGSLGRASEVLGSSQPTLSRRLAALEAVLGQALFERTRRGLRATPAGHALLAPAQRMREQIGQIAIAMDRHARTLAGTVRITASDVVSNFVLLPVLKQLRETYPEIQIELVPSDAVADLLGREADIAIRMFRPTEPSLIVRRLADMPLGFYAHERYLEKRGPVSDANLHQHEWLGMDRSDVLLKGFAAAGHPVPREFFPVRSDSSVFTWHAVCEGLGLGIGLQSVAARSPGIVRVLHEIPVPPLQTWLAVHRELRGSPRLRATFDLIATALARQPNAA